MSDSPGCHGELPAMWYRDEEHLRRELAAHGTLTAAGRAHGIRPATVRKGWQDLNLGPLPRGPRPQVVETAAGDEWLLRLLKKHTTAATVEQLADLADVSPKRVRESLERLGKSGYRVEDSDGKVVLDRVPRPSPQAHKVLFDGDVYRFGIASDAHLNSTHCLLDELHIAYDRFAAEGISTVYNPGDIVAGRGIYKGQDHEIINFTYETQKQFAIENYPQRDGIETLIVSGNHDCEGDFGRAGADACLGVANERDDIKWCGRYAASFVLPNGSVMEMRHPMGGSSYAKSYKPQKFAESFAPGHKPNVVLFGHWHSMLYIFTRNIHMLNCGTFEGSGNSLSNRVPLGEPATGFFIVEMAIAEDASVVRFKPEWFPFFAGRHA